MASGQPGRKCRFCREARIRTLLGRVEAGGGSPLANQTQTVKNYREALAGRPARIAVGRTVYPAADRATARRDLAEALEPLIASYIKSGFAPVGVTLEEILARLHIIYGHPEEIAEILVDEQARIGWTELLVQVDPGNLPHGRALKALELVAREIQPHLGNQLTVPAQAV